MKRYVISAPRSGLNWLRYCTEHFYGLRTPGKTVLISNEDQPDAAFERSHDALRYAGKAAWPKFTPPAAGTAKVALLLRDPLETFARMATGKTHKFGFYCGNIHFYSQTAADDRAVFYYEDIITQPSAMMALFEHLAFDQITKQDAPTREDVAQTWDAVSQASRGTYDVNQSAGGGAMTKANPTDFKFHQRGLDDAQKIRVWRYLKRNLSVDEFALLDRYAPDAPVKPQTALQSITDRFR